jgi:hypothetical protein
MRIDGQMQIDIDFPRGGLVWEDAVTLSNHKQRPAGDDQQTVSAPWPWRCVQAASAGPRAMTTLRRHRRRK